MLTIFPCVIVKPNTTRGRPPGGHTAPAAPLMSAVCAAAKTGFDPCQLTSSYLYFRIHPQRLQAWREANELAGRELMRGGVWVVA